MRIAAFGRHYDIKESTIYLIKKTDDMIRGSDRCGDPFLEKMGRALCVRLEDEAQTGRESVVLCCRRWPSGYAGTMRSTRFVVLCSTFRISLVPLTPFAHKALNSHIAGLSEHNAANGEVPL